MLRIVVVLKSDPLPQAEVVYTGAELFIYLLLFKHFLLFGLIYP